MEIFLEKYNPTKDLGGLCECFVQESTGERVAAEMHMHQSFELLYCRQGCFEVTADQHTCLLEPGGAVLIHPMKAHTTRSVHPGVSGYLVLKFMPESLYATGRQLYGLKYLFPYMHFNADSACAYTAEQLKDSQIPRLLEAILQERNLQGYGYELALHAYISQVMLWFLRAWQKQAGTGAVGERELLRLQRAQQYIDEHIDESLRQEDVAQHLGMGLSTFSRFFSETSGMSFPAYVRVRRLNKAAALLAQSSRPVTEIAAETGFSTASYLILCFRKQYGVTPAQFRKLSSVEA